HLSRLLLVPGLRGRDHGAVDRVPADFALPAELDELISEFRPQWPSAGVACIRAALATVYRPRCGQSRGRLLATRESTMRVIAKGLLGIALVAAGAVSVAQAQARWRGPAADWQTFAVPDFGTTVDYPAGIFSVAEGKSDKGIGQKFSSADGSAL